MPLWFDQRTSMASGPGIFFPKRSENGLLVKRVSMGSQRGYFKIVSDKLFVPAVERRADKVEVVGRVIWYGVKV